MKKSKNQELLDDLIEIAQEIANNYKQKWGDCYKVNSTVAYFINNHTKLNNAKIWQVIVDTEDKIFDSRETGYTNKIHHIMLTIGYDDDNFYPVFDDLMDFSNVFVGKRETSYYDGQVIDELGGEEDKKLMELLEKAYADYHLKSYQKKKNESILVK